MNGTILKLLLRQPLNSWKSLTPLARWQHAFLVFLLYAYAGNRLFVYLKGLRLQDAHAYLYLIWGSALFLTVVFFLTAPFVLRRFLPSQPEFVRFLQWPLRPNQLLTVTFYYSHKYWLVLWALFLPLLAALTMQNPFSALLLFGLTLAADVLILYLFFLLFFRSQTAVAFFGQSLGMTLLTVLGFYFFRNSPGKWPILLGILQLCLLLLVMLLKRSVRPESERWYALLPRTVRSSKHRHHALFLSGPGSALLGRDWLNRMRNPAYRKNKIVLALLLILAAWLVFRTYSAPISLPVFSGLWLALVWWHFSTAFSRRFAQSEPDWFLRLTPLPFVRFVCARFLSEFTFVLFFLILYATLLLLAGFPLSTQWQWLILLTFVSTVILCTMIVFQIIFYDDPRTAGYAYHFSVLFFLVMTLNYYFTGPLLTLLFLLVYFYKSYRFFKQ